MINNWHSWPDEKPDEEKRYLIYYQYKDTNKKAFFIGDYFPFEDRWFNLLNDITILAWKEIELPYL